MKIGKGEQQQYNLIKLIKLKKGSIANFIKVCDSFASFCFSLILMVLCLSRKDNKLMIDYRK